MGYEHCSCVGFDSYIKNGKDKLGKQRYKCKYCNKSLTMKREFKKLPTDLIYRKELSKAELYCLGYLYADGWVQKNRLGICVKKEDEYIIYLIKKVFNLSNKITDIKRTDGRLQTQILFRIAYFEEDLLHLGFRPCKTGQELWLDYMCNSSFIRGFMDGDGSVFIQNNSLRISFVCKQYSYLESLGVCINKLVNIPSKTIYDEGKASVHMMRYNGKEALLLGDYLYENSEGLRLERKYQKYLEIKNSTK